MIDRYAEHWITWRDIWEVVKVLRSRSLTGGDGTKKFEIAFADKVGADHAIAVSSATAGLHLSLAANDHGRGDEVIVTPNTFLASVNAIEYVGVRPRFVDIDFATGCISAARVIDVLMREPDVRALIAVDFAGVTPDMGLIYSHAKNRGVFVIEDAAHSLGTRFGPGGACMVGGHPFADATVFSFHPAKIITTGEGGMVTTRHEYIASKVRAMRSHGAIRDGCRMFDEPIDHPDFYEMRTLGWNYRLSEIQCALGMSQLARLEEIVSRRLDLVAEYHDALTDMVNMARPQTYYWGDNFQTAWHLYNIRLDWENEGTTRAKVMGYLKEHGVGTQVHYIPVHLQPYYRIKYGFKPGDFPEAERHYEMNLSLPLHPQMTKKEVRKVVSILKDAIHFTAIHFT